MNDRIIGKTAVVTGGAQGIGEAIVTRFFNEGAKAVALVDMNLEKAKETAKKIDPSGEKVIAFSCDVSSYEDTERCFNEIYEALGRVDILVNNAGINRDRTLCKMSIEEWSAVINVDLCSLFNTCKQVAPRMKEQEYGKIVNMSSAGFLGGFGQTNYASAKAGVIGFTRSLSRELARHNITVNAVCPAGVMTDMLMNMPEEAREKAIGSFPRKRAAFPSEIASVVLFLASDDSAFVNGEKILVTDAKYVQ